MNDETKKTVDNSNTETLTLLPVGIEEFNAWSDDIINLAGAPANDSLKFALAAMILSLPPGEDKYAKADIVKRVRKGMANQVASHVMWELKEKQKAEEAQKQTVAQSAESTGTSPALSVVPSGQTQQRV
jgi:hypothetical protein